MAMGGLFSRKGGGDAGPSRSPGSNAKLRPIRRDDAERRLALLDDFEESGLGWFWATDAEGRLTYLTANAAQQLETGADALLGRSLSSLFVPDQEEEQESQRTLGFLLSSRHSIADLPVRVAAGERETWWTISGKPQLDGEGNFLGYRGSARDSTAQRESQRDAARLAQYDSLTGLANRHRMSKRLTSTLTAYRAAKRSCALLMLDLDRFKQVNDTLGHPAGDELLKQVAQRIGSLIGKRGEIGRLGGDEFQIILPDMDDRGELGDLAARLIQMVSQPYSIDGSRAIIGSSVGIAIAPYDGLETEELVSSADLALYAAKGGGRGQYRFYSSELKDGARLRRQIEEDLRDALHAGQIDLCLQPIVRVDNNTVSGFEALLRWEHPDRGPIAPDEFVPIAEESAIINEIGEFAIDRACELAAAWPVDLRVAVNVSPVQFASGDLAGVVERALARTGLSPHLLELEITESVFLGDQEATHRLFKHLKKIGVRLSLDDFGTGYSSLGYLRRAPFDKIKIDRSFVRGATQDDNNNAAIITAIVSLAEALDMETVAEGVEAMDELELVRARGTSHVQGYIYSRPLTQVEVLERLADDKLECEPEGPARHRADRQTVFKRIGVIHEDHRYDVVLRNLSRTGARIEGLLEVPEGTDLVLDLGGGQLAVAVVRRSDGYTQGLEFETPLVRDGTDGLCTRHRVSPYALAAAGMPLASLPPGHYPLFNAGEEGGSRSRPKFLQVDLSHAGSKAA